MALRHIDSFNHTTDPITDGKYQSGSLSYNSTSGRFDAGGFHAISSGGGTERRLVRILSPGHTTWIVGVALYFYYPNDVSLKDHDFLKVQEGTTIHTNVTHRALTDGFLSIERAGTTILATGTTALNPDTWYWVEFKTIVSDTVGLAEVYLNGGLECGYYGAGTAGAPTGDTRNGLTGTADRIMLTGVSSGASDPTQYVFDDYYICDGSGSAPTNDYLGDVRVECLFPNGDGTTSQLDGSDGNQVNNYLLVDDPTNPDDDTTYVESADVGDKDTYAYGALTSVSGTVYGIQINPFAKKTDAGARSMQTVTRLSATEVDGTAQALSSSYAYFSEVQEAKPGGGIWTIADVNSAEFGTKVAS